MENEILEIFRSVFNEEDSSSITLETEFRDLAQFTSLTQVVLIDAIQNQLNVKLKLLPLIKAETIGDVLPSQPTLWIRQVKQSQKIQHSFI